MNQDDTLLFDFEIITPEQVVLSSREDRITLPAVEGETQVRPRHTKMTILLESGVVRIHKEREPEVVYYINGGFVDITPAYCHLMTEVAEPLKEINIEHLAEKIGNLERRLEEMEAEATEDQRSAELAPLYYKLEQFQMKYDLISAYLNQ